MWSSRNNRSATMPGESLNADLAGPIVPMDLDKYALVIVDELTRFARVSLVRKKGQTARLLVLLIQRINTKTRRPEEPRVRRLHTDKGGEFKSKSLEEFCQWKGIIRTFTNRAQHQSNGLGSGRSDSSMSRPVLPYSPVTCQPTCGLRCTWLCAKPRTLCPVVRCSGS